MKHSIPLMGLVVTIIVIFTFGIFSTSLLAEAQETKPVRVGVLWYFTGALDLNFRPFLNELGWIEGQNIVIHERSAEGQPERFLTLAQELADLQVDVLFTQSTQRAQAMKQATTTIPVVFGFAPDPVGAGLVASLPRPGGNLTGVALLVRGMSGKRLGLLTEAVPNIRRVGILVHPKSTYASLLLQETEQAAQSATLQIRILPVHNREEIKQAFQTMATEHLDAFLALPDQLFFLQRRLIIELAAQYQLPTIYDEPELARTGGLMAYGETYVAHFRRSVVHLDKVMRGANPSNLPVERPTKFELVINLKTAKQIGVTIPPEFLFQADQVIQ